MKAKKNKDDGWVFAGVRHPDDDRLVMVRVRVCVTGGAPRYFETYGGYHKDANRWRLYTQNKDGLVERWYTADGNIVQWKPI